jgi:hypothetical protein
MAINRFLGCKITAISFVQIFSILFSNILQNSDKITSLKLFTKISEKLWNL